MLFIRDRSVFIKVDIEHLSYTIPNPWATVQLTGTSQEWQEWQAAELAGEVLNGPNDDPDQDGTSNLLEFVFGTPPLQAGAPTATPVEIVTVSGQRFLQMTIPRIESHQAILRVQVSSDLMTWDQGPAVTEVVSSTPTEMVVRRVMPLGAGESKFFMRLSAEVPAP
jgi:hypothetical protein